MGMFSDLMGKIFNHAPAASNNAFAGAQAHGTVGGTGTATAAAPSATAVAEPVDVEAILDKLAAGHTETLDWKHSIVDMMKLLGMDSSLTSRKALAADLHYSGNTDDSAAMNIWLHKEVMQKLSQNGGHVPASLLAH
ncbi:MAG: hypothetical protein QOK37_3714 [Thermoanaerobaculia bacterium]|jgi:hypothetical protein|nr:hypothetical protein [Thermoanaerobaculia bacterium]